MKTPEQWAKEFKLHSAIRSKNFKSQVEQIQLDATASKDAEIERFKKELETLKTVAFATHNQLKQSNTSLLEQNQKLMKDKERMDWLDKRQAHIYTHFKYHQSTASLQPTWRQAIDSAIAQEALNPKEK